MPTLLDDHQRAGDAAVAAGASWMACCKAFDLNDMSVQDLDLLHAEVGRVASFSQGMRVRVAAQRAKLIEAGKSNTPPDSGSGSTPDADNAPLPKPGASRKEQRQDADAARAVGWAPSFGVALEAGEISMDHVAALGRVRNFAQVPKHESALLCVAKMRTAEDFAKWLVSWDAARDDDAGIDRTARQRTRRRIGFSTDAEGLGTIFGALPSLDAKKVENTLRQIANELFHASGDDGTTLAQRLADALVLMAERATGGGATAKPTRPTLVVICNEDSLRDRIEDAGLGYTLDGHPVPVSDLRRLACHADILPAVMNGHGKILDFGHRRRVASDAQRLALLSMYGGCIIDGCGCPTELLEIHHLTAYEHGGPTDLENLAPLCNRDHTRSHTEKWTYTRDPDGHLTVNTRDGTEVPSRRPRVSSSAVSQPASAARSAGCTSRA